MRLTSLLRFLFGTINTCSDLFVNCIWIAEVFQANFVWWWFSWFYLAITTRIPSQPSYKPTTKSKFSLPENVRIVYACTQHSFNVTINIPCFNMYCTKRYKLEMVFDFCVYLLLRCVMDCMYLTAFTCL